MEPLSFQSKIRPTSIPTAAPTPGAAVSFASKARPVSAAAPVADNPAQKGSILKTVGNFLVSSEKAVANDLTAGTRAKIAAKSALDSSNSQYETEKTIIDLIAKQKEEGRDTSHAEATLAGIRNNSVASNGDISKDVPEINKTNLQGLGDVAGVAADVLSAGSYGAAAKGAKPGSLLVKGGGAVEKIAAKAGIPTTQKIVAPVVKAAVKPATSVVLKEIGKKTAIRAATGGATGYGYDVAGNMQSGKTGAATFKPGLGTYTGVALPLAIGAIQAGAAVTKDLAPRIINSLVKPKTADFSYGKNPGRTVAEMGITGNNLDDFGSNINKARNDVGQKIGAVYANPANANVRVNGAEEVAKIDKAIAEAAKGGKNNQTIVTQLQNVKDALLFDHVPNEDGIIEKVGDVPRDLSNLTADEAFALKQKVADATQFTGRPSDDKTVNAILKDIYSGIKEKLNAGVKPNNPEIEKLNQQYGDLISAEIATRNRDKIVQRSNLVGLKTGGAGAVGSLIGLMSGVGTVPTILAGVAAATFEKALATTAVKTRVAAWLGKEAPGAVFKFLQANPQIAPILLREFPLLLSKLGKSPNLPAANPK